MLVKIKQAFPYAADGFTVRELQAGAVENVHDDLIAGLEDEDLVERVKESSDGKAPAIAAPAAAEAVDDPAGPAEAEPAHAAPSAAAPPAVDAYPNLSPAQEEALDRVADGQVKPGGSAKRVARKPRAKA